MNGSWTCIRIVNPDETKDLKDDVLTLIRNARKLQLRSMYPLPLIAAFSLIFWAFFLTSRHRSQRGKRFAAVGLWATCAIGFAGAIVPQMLDQARNDAASMYGPGAKNKLKMSILNIVFTWVAFACHLIYVIMAVILDRREVKRAMYKAKHEG